MRFCVQQLLKRGATTPSFLNTKKVSIVVSSLISSAQELDHHTLACLGSSIICVLEKREDKRACLLNSTSSNIHEISHKIGAVGLINFQLNGRELITIQCVQRQTDAKTGDGPMYPTIFFCEYPQCHSSFCD